MKSEFTGSVLGWIGIQIFVAFSAILTFGLATPWAVCYAQEWHVEHTIIDGNRLRFDGTGSQLFGKFIIWLLLAAVTFGIYVIWIPVKTQQWLTENTHMYNTSNINTHMYNTFNELISN